MKKHISAEDLLLGLPGSTSINMSEPSSQKVRCHGPDGVESCIALYMAVSLMAIIIVVGCAGNVMVIMAVRMTKKLQVVSNAFVVNLSICDLMFVTIILPFNIYTYITDGWDLPITLCKAIGFLGYTLTGTTIITITLIAWNRYKLVVDPRGYSDFFSPRSIRIMLALAWIIPILCLLPAALEVWGRFGYVSMMVTCNLLLDHESQSFKLFLLIVRAVIPCGLIIYYYCAIYRTTKASHRRVRKGKMLQAATTGGRLDLAIQRKELHLTKMMATIFIIFALSYFPCTVSTIVDWNTMLSKRFHMFCLITVYMGSAVNPLIYGLMNSQFRLAYYSILLCRCCQPLPEKHYKSTTTTSSPSPRIKKKSKKNPSPEQKLLSENEGTSPTNSPEPHTPSDEDNAVDVVVEDCVSDDLMECGRLHRSETEKTYLAEYSPQQSPRTNKTAKK